jgi:hypothetical protein
MLYAGVIFQHDIPGSPLTVSSPSDKSYQTSLWRLRVCDFVKILVLHKHYVRCVCEMYNIFGIGLCSHLQAAIWHYTERIYSYCLQKSQNKNNINLSIQ